MKKRVVFMGTPSYATTIFKKLYENNSYDVVALFTQSDKKVGRKQILTPPHIKQYCIDNNIDIEIFQPQRLRENEEAFGQIKDLKPDFIIVAAFGQILPKEILDIAPCINLHASILPQYRGASPIQEGILNDDKYLGVTSMFMEEGLDSGDILGYKYLENRVDLEVAEAFELLSDIAADLTISTLDNYLNINPQKQDETKVSFCKKIRKDDGLVDFSDAKKLFLKYKAYSFWPGVFIKSGLKLKDISLKDENSNNKEGEILEINSDNIVIACKKGSIRVKTIQAPSKKAIKSVDYIRGQRINIGEIII